MPRWALVLAGVALGACATQSAPTGDPFEHTVASQEAVTGGRGRIQYVGEFSSPSDLGYRAAFSARFKRFLGGGREARLIRPYAVDGHGDRLAIADPGSGQVVYIDRKRERYSVIGTADSFELSSPVGVALSNDFLYVADSALGKVFIFDRKQHLVQTLDQFDRPTSLAYDHSNLKLYVTDAVNHTISVVDERGVTLQHFGSRGSGDSKFNYPTHITLVDDRLLVVDALNFRVQVFSSEGNFLGSFGVHGDQRGQFAQPKGIAADPEGHIYIAESVSGLIQVFDLDGNFLAAFGSLGNEAGSFLLPAGIHIEGNRIYVADSGNGRVQMFRYRGGDG